MHRLHQPRSDVPSYADSGGVDVLVNEAGRDMDRLGEIIVALLEEHQPAYLVIDSGR